MQERGGVLTGDETYGHEPTTRSLPGRIPRRPQRGNTQGTWRRYRPCETTDGDNLTITRNDDCVQAKRWGTYQP